MTSPAFGIAYSIWLRLRWTLGAVLALLAIFVVTMLFFPATTPYFHACSVGLIFFAILPILQACTFGPADFGVRTSGFPTHMLVLPMSNRSLVGWPMLYGMVMFGMLWILLSVLVFLPSGLPLPVVWPALFMGAVCAWVQAIAWSSFPSPFARVPVLVISILPLYLVPVTAGVALPGYMVFILFASGITWSYVAYRFGVRGLSRARSGHETVWFRSLIDRVLAVFQQSFVFGRVERRPFPSAAIAQFWHECRRNALVMPIMLSLIGLPFMGVMCISVWSSENHSGIAVGSFHITQQMFALSIWLAIPVLLSSVCGPGLAKFDVWGKEQMPAFFAIRPMATSQFIFIKLAAIAVSTLITWAIMLGLFAVWALVEASPLNSRDSVVQSAFTQAKPRSAAVVAALLVGLAILMWRNILVGMTPSLLGRKWVTTAVGATCAFLIGLAVLAGMWVYKHPEIQSQLPSFVPWIIGLLFVEKACGAAVAGLGLRRWRVSARHLAILYATWIVLAGLLIAIVSCFVSLTWTIAAGLALFVPFARFAVMPLALDLNRHR